MSYNRAVFLKSLQVDLLSARDLAQKAVSVSCFVTVDSRTLKSTVRFFLVVGLSCRGLDRCRLSHACLE